jgi:hypothetical protein
VRKRSRKEKKAIHAKTRSGFTVGEGYGTASTKTRKRSKDYGDIF